MHPENRRLPRSFPKLNVGGVLMGIPLLGREQRVRVRAVRYTARGMEQSKGVTQAFPQYECIVLPQVTPRSVYTG
jgi:hypothetical protein